MPSFLESVADLTDPRDVDYLDGRLASIVFDLIQGSTVSLWRWATRENEVALVKRLTTGPSDVALESKHPDIDACRTATQPLLRVASITGRYLYLFPITDKDEMGLTLEISRVSPLASEDGKSVLALVQIYRNLLSHLESSRHDALTGLLNRRTFDASFEQAIRPGANADGVVLRDRRDASENGSSSHIAVVDIDHFKRINDRFGHLYGDEVLVLLGRLMKYCFRQTDSLFRFGGEEFVVILRGTTQSQAETALERFRTAVERFAFPQVGTVTVSIGFTAVQADDNGPNAFGRADEALYVVKRSGRNQTCSHETLTTIGILTRQRVQYEQNVEMFG